MIRLKEILVRFYLQHRRGVVITAVAVISCWFVINGLMQIPNINKNREETAMLETKKAEEKERQSDIDDLTTKVNTDEYIAKIASEKLGLVKSNATIFYDISDEN